MSNQRFTALDVFRGMTVCFMIIVNTPGTYDTIYAPLEHASWHGFTPTDLVFPSFLFAVGNALSFTAPKMESLSNKMVVQKIFKRTCIIFLLGYLMYWFPFVQHTETGYALKPLSDTRIFGVLQRIALCYGLTALMIHFFKLKATLIISIGLLFFYWIILSVFGNNDVYAIESNASNMLDKFLFGETHLYNEDNIRFDPEGLLGTLPAIGNVVAGYFVGFYIQKNGKTYEVLTKLLLTGIGLAAIAYCWNFYFPINKKLWTSSYVLLTVGLDCIIISAIIYVVDFLQKTKWTNFFEVFGRNPLFIYLLSELCVSLLNFIHVNADTSLYDWIFANIFSHVGGYFGSFLFALSFMFLCWGVGYFMDKKKIYVKV
jgi:predicted acyltransferase